MARGQRPRRHRSGDGAGDGAEATITQALYMIRMYAEILAMQETVMKRIHELVRQPSDERAREATLANMELLLVQLDKIGPRIAYWNAEVHRLLTQKLGS
jgi:uncharacterized small protein (DUF1192 family)